MKAQIQKKVQTATLSFDMEDFEARKQLKRALAATDLFIAVSEFYTNSLRKRLKYEELTEEVYNILEQIKQEYWETINEYVPEFSELE